jgi:hypothetical protein
METVITNISGKAYEVSHVFNMVGNWHFTDKKGTSYLVDGEDVSAWCDEKGMRWDGVYTAIAYAREIASMNDGVFWWKVRENIA